VGRGRQQPRPVVPSREPGPSIDVGELNGAVETSKPERKRLPTLEEQIEAAIAEEPETVEETVIEEAETEEPEPPTDMPPAPEMPEPPEVPPGPKVD